MTPSMSSRERMLAALGHQPVDYVPCAFMLYGALKSRCASYAEFIERQVEMGLDTIVELPPRPPQVVNDYYNLHGLPVTPDPQVKTSEWVEQVPGEEWPILVKEYLTPAGPLRCEVRQTADWRWGDHVPFLDDYIVPRARKHLVEKIEDLPALEYLLGSLSEQEIADFRAAAQPAIEQARRHGLLLAGGWGVGADLIGWVHGLSSLVYSIHDQPEFIAALLDLIARWNRQRMAVLLEANLDLYIKRAWYENCDFWSPRTWKKYLFPILQEDVALTHQAGTRFAYLLTSNAMPLVDLIAEAGVDVLIGVDPQAWDLPVLKHKLQGKVALWGGVNGHLTVEQGQPAEVRQEVQRAMECLAPGSGFILSPVDNVREDTARSWENVQALLEEWRRLRAI